MLTLSRFSTATSRHSQASQNRRRATVDRNARLSWTSSPSWPNLASMMRFIAGCRCFGDAFFGECSRREEGGVIRITLLGLLWVSSIPFHSCLSFLTHLTLLFVVEAGSVVVQSNTANNQHSFPPANQRITRKMKFSAFVAVTTAGLAVAMPVVPRQELPGLDTVTSVTKGAGAGAIKRQIGALGGMGGIGSLLGGDKDKKNATAPAEEALAKRQLDSLMSLLGGSKDEKNATAPATDAVEKRQLDSLMSLLGGSKDEKNATAPAEDSVTSALAKRQLDSLMGLLGGSKDEKNATAPAEDSATSALAKRQLDSLMGLLGGDKDKNATAPTTDAAAPVEDAAAGSGLVKRGLGLENIPSLLGGGDKKNATAPAETPAKDAEAAPADDSATSGLLKRQAEDVIPKEPKEPKEPVDPTEDNTTTVETDGASAANATSALGGLTKRQLGSLLGGEDESSKDQAVPEEPKEPKEPVDPTEETNEAAPADAEESSADATSALGGLA